MALLRLALATGLTVATVAACAAPNLPTDVETTGIPNPELALLRAIDRVDADMAQIGGMRSPSPYPPAQSTTVVPDELKKPVQFVWNGPLDDGVRKLAGSIGYTVSVSAPPNAGALPVAVNINGQVVAAFQALGDQAGTSATVSVDPLHHQVQVIHHV
jgi:defect in organelle trafficking protein DotD